MLPTADASLELSEKYESLLRASLSATASQETESALNRAYEFGRSAFAAGLGVLEMVELHNRIVARIVDSRPPRDLHEVLATCNRFLLESLTPFEMTHRGFREANEALQASEERYRELFQNANDIIFTTDLEGRITSLNRAGEMLTGYTRSEALSLNVNSLIAPEFQRIPQHLRQLKLGTLNTRRHYELDILARDGRRIPLEISTRLIYEDGTAVGVQGIARDITDRRQAESALRHLNQRLEDKVKSIAHALHDEAGQLLASVYLHVAEIAGELPHRGRQRLDELRALLDQVDDQLRRLAHELRPTILDDLGLLPACEFLAEGVSKRARIHVQVRGSTGGRLPPDVETALYRVAQEALTNATRHAHPKLVNVEFLRVGRTLRGAIRDDGVGFDVPAVLTRTNKQGLGLMGMRERLVAVGGKLTIVSSPGRGTSVEFEVPLEV